jgi:lysine-N-methylase
MQVVAPDYYKNFKCIAGECKHSCCIGWEIDVDFETLDIYKNITGEWGERLKNSISYEGGTPHFITNKNGRCAFLNEKGLCDIITAFGEDGLCQICYDHPRFRNFFSDRVEIGLGLCCEAAANLILKNKNKIKLTTLEKEGENHSLTHKEITLFKNRDSLFDLIYNKTFSVKEIVQKISKDYKLNLLSANLSDMVKKYSNLERLDNSWDEFLNKTQQKNLNFDRVLNVAEEKISMPARNLMGYFVYRYFVTKSLDESQRASANFILENTCFCLAVCISCCEDLTTENLCEVGRMFSSEIEYSEENVQSLLKEISQA